MQLSLLEYIGSICILKLSTAACAIALLSDSIKWTLIWVNDELKNLRKVGVDTSTISSIIMHSSLIWQMRYLYFKEKRSDSSDIFINYLLKQLLK